VLVRQDGPIRVRTVQSDPPFITIGSYQHRCNDCHRLFRPALERLGVLMQHSHILLDHGMNDNCFNCHERGNRERLVLRNGRTASFTDVPLLCAQCHGPTYRDWQRGMHGKDMEFWNADAGPIERLVCTQCHDPHAPAYPDFVPLPPPNTLRMGSPPSPSLESHARHRPLQPWTNHAVDDGKPSDPLPEDHP
jgi:hypothetical protein